MFETLSAVRLKNSALHNDTAACAVRIMSDLRALGQPLLVHFKTLTKRAIPIRPTYQPHLV